MCIENRIYAMERQAELSRDDYAQLEKWVDTQDDYIRDLIASLLVNFPTNKSLNILCSLTQDNDSLVRADAFDSLSEFPCSESFKILFDAMFSESDDISRFCAIRSCAEVILLLGRNSEDVKSIFGDIYRRDPSDLCKLASCYGMFLFGEDNALALILAFLGHPDYHIRCSTISVFREILDDNNKQVLKEAVMQLKKNEQSEAVISSIDEFLIFAENN